MTRAECRKPRRLMKRNASVQTMPPMMSQTTMSGRSAPATGTVKNTTLPSQSAMGASHALIVWSTVIDSPKCAMARTPFGQIMFVDEPPN